MLLFFTVVEDNFYEIKKENKEIKPFSITVTMNNIGVAQDKNLRQYGEFLVKGAHVTSRQCAEIYRSRTPKIPVQCAILVLWSSIIV